MFCSGAATNGGAAEHGGWVVAHALSAIYQGAARFLDCCLTRKTMNLTSSSVSGQRLFRFSSAQCRCVPRALLQPKRHVALRSRNQIVTRRTVRISNSSAATWASPAGFHKPHDSIESGEVRAPLELPPTPKSSGLIDVFPYLAKLALSEKTLYWRLAGALALMVISKVAGIALSTPIPC